MAQQMIATNGQIQYNVDEYVIDTPEDTKKLPKRCVMGSTALCTSTGDVYIKNGKGEWVILGDTGSSSGSGSGGNIGPISYNDLIDKPSLNGKTIQGEMEIDTISPEVIDQLLSQP